MNQPVGTPWGTMGTQENWQFASDPMSPTDLLIMRINDLEILTQQQGEDILALQVGQADQDVKINNHETRIVTLEQMPPGTGGGTGGIPDVSGPTLSVRKQNAWVAATQANLGFATVADVAALSQVARTGNYNDLINKPTIPLPYDGIQIRDQLQLLAFPVQLSALFIKDLNSPTLADGYANAMISGLSINVKSTFITALLDALWAGAEPGSYLMRSNDPLGGYDWAVPVPVNIGAGGSSVDLTGYTKLGTPVPTVGRMMQLAAGATLVDAVSATRAQIAVGAANVYADTAAVLAARALQPANTTTGATCTLDLTTGIRHRHTAGAGDVTMAFPAVLPDGQVFEFSFYQDATGGRSLIFPTTAGGKTWVMQNKAAFDTMVKTAGIINRFVGRVDGNDIRITFVGQDYRF